MPEMKQELVMETTHGRKNKCKTEFKAVMNKVLVSGLILATMMSTTMPALAAVTPDAVMHIPVGVTQTNGVSYESTVYEIKATIASINEMKAQGLVTNEMLSKLANQIYTLQSTVSYSDNVDLNEVSNLLDSAYEAVEGVQGNTNVVTAITVARAMLGLDNEVVDEKEESVVVNNAQAAPMVTSFSDVQPGAWYYDSVTAMTQKGYFAGKGEIVNGVGRFAPEDTMTKAEFLTVTARILFDEDNLKGNPDDIWWKVYYDAMVNNGVITSSDISVSDIEQPMTREEMAMVAVKVLEYKGESFDGLYTYNIMESIPDMGAVNSAYRDYVIKAYGKGILVGVDTKGTYAPQNTLLRAEATTVLYRIVDKDQRDPADFSQGGSAYKPQMNESGLKAVDPDNGRPVPQELVNSDSTAPIIIYEGQVRHNRPAKAGDTFVKKDGTQVIVTTDQYGIVGGGQGLQLDVGLEYNSASGPCAVSQPFSYGGGSLGGTHNGLYWVDSQGNLLRNKTYKVNRTTGEAHWQGEWKALYDKISKPTHQGTEGEVSQDAYHLYRWDSEGYWTGNVK